MRSSSRTATPITSWAWTKCGGSTRCKAGAIPAYADERTAGDLRRTFCYVFDPPNEKGGGIPQIGLTTIDGALQRRFGVGIQPVPIFHGSRPILGFRFGIVRVPDRLQPPRRRGVAAARRRRHPDPRRAAPSPASDALHRRRGARGRRARSSRGRPTSRTSATTCRTRRPTQSLPAGVELAYDGLSFDDRGGVRLR